jgi:hypothetical protein
MEKFLPQKALLLVNSLTVGESENSDVERNKVRFGKDHWTTEITSLKGEQK